MPQTLFCENKSGPMGEVGRFSFIGGKISSQIKDKGNITLQAYYLGSIKSEIDGYPTLIQVQIFKILREDQACVFPSISENEDQGGELVLNLE